MDMDGEPVDLDVPEVDLTPDPIARKLEGLGAIPNGCASLKGYLGPANDEGIHRIYLDNSFWKWLEVKAGDIVYRVVTPDNDRDSRDEFWIKRGADVVNCQASVVQEIERELSGDSDDGGGYWGRPPW